jgi:hypothetical protein
MFNRDKAKIDYGLDGDLKTNLEIADELGGERVMIGASAIAALATAAILVYNAYASDRLEQVFLTQDVMDAPVLLEKIRTSESEVRIDRHVRGFTRRFIARFFIHGDDSTDFVKKSLQWTYAHSGEGGQKRSDFLLKDFASYDAIRKDSFSSFFPVNDPSTFKVSSSKERENIIYIQQPGTYVVQTPEGEAFYDGELELTLRKVPISGLETDHGELNITGLIVESGSVSYIEDYTRGREVTKKNLFGF